MPRHRAGANATGFAPFITTRRLLPWFHLLHFSPPGAPPWRKKPPAGRWPGLGPELVLPQLRAQTVQELLAQPGGAGCELCGTLQTLTGALTQCVRRRPGWLYVMFPSGITCPVPARPALVQAAVLEALRPVLACGGQAVLEVKPRSRAVLLCLRGGAPAGVLPLWQALARQSGGAVVFDSGAQFAAAAFLPLCPGCRIQKSPSTQELLEDRFSLPYLFLSGYCAGPW